MNLKNFIRSIPDYPKKGILFRDITTLIKDETAFAETINQIVERSKKFNFTKIAAIESRLYSCYFGKIKFFGTLNNLINSFSKSSFIFNQSCNVSKKNSFFRIIWY